MQVITPSLVAAISLAAIVVAGSGPVGTAFAQTPTPVTLNSLFGEDLAEIGPEGMGKLQEAVKKARRDCYPPRIKFTIVTQNVGDPLFVKTLGKARVEALKQAVSKLGLKDDQFKVDSVIGAVDGVLVNYDKFTPDDDKNPPTLKVTWTPRKGTKVRAGDKIKATVRASERYEDGHKSWPTGVYNIQLTADDGLVDSKDYGRMPQPCERRTLEASYTVPRNPPPIVHLRAIAEDAGGNKDSDVGKFPTVEVWHGTDEHFYDITGNDGVEDVRSVYKQLVRFELYETSKDKLEGEAHATYTSSQEVTNGKCAGVKTRQDPEIVEWDMQLAGSIQHLPGSTRFEFHATPNRGPPYKEISTPGGECITGSTQEANNNSWEGATFTLKTGQDHYDFSYSAPSEPGHTGDQHYKLHVESSGK